jgi:2-succinyl-5-enolpyruvyl-6-hydroxy-3-cyclohexene-1-carboxylate synthase
MHHIDYFSAADEIELEGIWKEFYSKNNRSKLLEIFTPKEENALVLKAYFNAMKES